MKKKAHINQLYDFYEELLTNRQQEIFQMYYMDDFSLAEIGAALQISRNAVFDTLKKVEVILEDYESKLHLLSIFHTRNQLLNQLKTHTDEIGLALIEQLERME